MTHVDANPSRLTLSALQTNYQEGTRSAREVILTLQHLALSDTHNAWIHVLSEAELEPYLKNLDQSDPNTLPLYGVPFGVKDNIDVAGIPSTAACPAFSYVPQQSARVVELLVAAGAVPIGKTNLDQFATGLVGVRSPYGETMNALNPDYISGGSSAGSAVATALGQVSFALGTDTAGSGRVPTAFNNLIGHKPSPGLISTTGVVPACRSLDCVSIMATTTADVATILSICAQFDASDPYSQQNPHGNSLRHFGAVLPEFIFGVPEPVSFEDDLQAQALFETTIRTLESLGGKRKNIDFAPFTEAAQLLYEGPWVAERRIATHNVRPDDTLPVFQQVIANNADASAEAAFRAQYRLKELKRQCDAQLKTVDFILTPTTPTIYTRQQVNDNPIALNSKLSTYTNFMNLLDYAATAVPAGFLDSGTTWGVTLFAQRDTDYALLSMAHRLQSAIGLPLGAGKEGSIPEITTAAAYENSIPIVVCGAHLEGQPLHWQLAERGAKLIDSTRTSPNYALYALADNKRPALVRSGDAQIEVEVWSLPQDTWGSFVNGIASPLGIGKVELEDGQWHSGFICADGVPVDAQDITEYGGWRAWKER